MCTYLHSFLDRNSILCSRFGHWEIIQLSLQIIRGDLRIPFMSAARARSMSSLAWGNQAHLGPFHSPAIHWVHWLWQLKGIWGRGRSWNCRGTQSHR